ncbi:MAG: glycosyltransferase [Chloroflexi bacterium]|nr:glycosyltransferase [Chloroflexota bacterium]
MRLAVVVGTYNRLAYLRRCIESIVAETRTPTVVYVADAGSTDGTRNYLESLASDRLVPIFAGKKLGQARAYNEVFALVRTPYVAWLSDDNRVINRGLDVAVDILERWSRIGMVGLKTREVEGPSAIAPYLGAISSIGILNVNQGVLRTPILQQVGGFSEAFRDYGIDPDLTAKVLFSGHDVAYTRGVALQHYRAWADGSEASVAQRERQRAYKQRYAAKWGRYAPPGPVWKLRGLAWKALQRLTGMHLNAQQTTLALNGRDWCNLVTGRYISPLDPLLTRGRPYHLLQCAPCVRRPLPSDPN